ncbi:unnamed protein product [Peniophora sp. CBMAI 1063]|nr:unnamed protein product [Peniophora sp. CBMAI 1063]
MAASSDEIQYPQEGFFRAMERRFADEILYFDPFLTADLDTVVEAVMTPIFSELVLLLAVVGRVRLQTGLLPPKSLLIIGVLQFYESRERADLVLLPDMARHVLLPTNGRAPPCDTTRFPQWWLQHPRNWLASAHIIDRQAAEPTFDLSQWIIRTVGHHTSLMKLLSSQGAEAEALLADLGHVLQRLQRLREALYEVGRGVEDVHQDEEDAFVGLQQDRRRLLTVAQRRYEAATGLEEAEVPFPVPPIPNTLAEA